MERQPDEPPPSILYFMLLISGTELEGLYVNVLPISILG
jgi:hypothetical protein